MIKTKIALLIIIIAAVVTGCNSGDDSPCLLPQTTYLRIGTYQNSDTSNAIFDTALPKPVWIAIDSGVIIQYAAKSNKFALTLSPLADSCRYVLQPDSAIQSYDTLVFYYEKNEQFLSTACGYTYFYNLLSLKTSFNNIDSAVIKNPVVNNDVNTQEHLQIFF